jgi:dihydrolipoamide dehydrogenase
MLYALLKLRLLVLKTSREKDTNKIGKFPFSASGKSKDFWAPDGFVKNFDAKYGEWLGCHMIGAGLQI